MIIDFVCTTTAGCRNTMSSPRVLRAEILKNLGLNQHKARPARTCWLAPAPKTNTIIVSLVFGGIIFHDELIFLISLVVVVF